MSRQELDGKSAAGEPFRAAFIEVPSPPPIGPNVKEATRRGRWVWVVLVLVALLGLYKCTGGELPGGNTDALGPVSFASVVIAVEQADEWLPELVWHGTN